MPPAKAVLAIDVGNSRVSMACVSNENVSQVLRFGPADPAAGDAMEEICTRQPTPQCIVACSVNSANLDIVAAAARDRLDRELLVVGQDLPLPIQTDLPQPQRVGTDRLCAAAMAYHRLRQACVVADFGTAVTIDCVSQEGVFLGGAILPGLGMGADALARGTAALPRVALARPDWVFGKDTAQAIVGGLVYGARGALRELAEAYATALGSWPQLILTGGDAELVGKGCDFVDSIVPDLALMGVALAYQLAPPSKS